MIDNDIIDLFENISFLIRRKTKKEIHSRLLEIINELDKLKGYQEKIEGKWSATDKGKPFRDRKPVGTNSRSDKDQLLRMNILQEILNNFCGGYIVHLEKKIKKTNVERDIIRGKYFIRDFSINI